MEDLPYRDSRPQGRIGPFLESLLPLVLSAFWALALGTTRRGIRELFEQFGTGGRSLNSNAYFLCGLPWEWILLAVGFSGTSLSLLFHLERASSACHPCISLFRCCDFCRRTRHCVADLVSLKPHWVLVKRSYDAAGSMRAVVDLVTGIRVERDYDALLRQAEERVYLDAEDYAGDGVLWTRLKYAYSAAGDRIGMAMCAARPLGARGSDACSMLRSGAGPIWRGGFRLPPTGRKRTAPHRRCARVVGPRGFAACSTAAHVAVLLFPGPVPFAQKRSAFWRCARAPRAGAKNVDAARRTG
jgi:hypothetical protein